MKRKEFIGNLTALGIGSILVQNTEAEANPKEKTSENAFLEDINLAKKPIKKLENEFLSFEWNNDASAKIIVKKTNTTWNMGSVAYQEDDEIDRGHVWVRQERSMCEQYPGRFNGKIIGNQAQFTLLNRINKVQGNFNCEAVLEGNSLLFVIKNIDEKIPNLSFPPPIQNNELILPIGIGKRITKPSGSRFFYTFFSHLNMRFFGGLQAQNGYAAIFEKNYEDAGVSFVQLCANPVWQKSLGKYNNSYTIRYVFSEGGYVGLAKMYRNWFKNNGLFKSLDEKIKENPQLGNLIGGRMISAMVAVPNATKQKREERLEINFEEKAEEKTKILSTYKKLNEVISACKEAGMKKGIFNIRGWIRGGYDYSHPDIWPPETALGTVDELKQICEMQNPYSVVLHDNYQDTYEHNPSFPRGININKKGNLMLGGYWAPGQCYILHTKASVENANRNWENIKTLNAKGMFVDTITAMQLYESYEQNNLQTRKQDADGKIKLMEFFKSKNQLLGSEEAADFGIKHIDWLENRHSRNAGETIPLWTLVFHDAVMNARYNNNASENASQKLSDKSKKPQWLEDMLWGYFMLYWTQNKKEISDQPEAIKNTLQVDEWFGKIATAEMTNHEFLTADFEVEKTTFSNGKSIIVNFGKETKTVQNQVIEGYSYKILE